MSTSAAGRAPNNDSRSPSSVAVTASSSFSYSARPLIMPRMTGTSFSVARSIRRRLVTAIPPGKMLTGSAADRVDQNIRPSLALRSREVAVPHHTDGPRPKRQHEDTPRPGGRHHSRRVRTTGCQIEHDDVRLHRGQIESNPGTARDPIGDDLRVGVVVGESLDVMVDRVEASGGKDAHLAHRAAKHPAVTDGACHEIFRSSK